MFLETHSLPKSVKNLLILNIGIYVLLRVTGSYYYGVQWLSLMPSEVIHHGQVWRLFSYLFIHSNIFWHLVLNMFALWMFGPEIERRLGSFQFAFYYLLTGVCGGLCTLLVKSDLGGIVIGSSASIFGLLVAFAMLFPNAIITMIFPPVSLKAKNFVIIFGIIQLLLVFEGSSGISWIVHIGGMLSGYLYFKLIQPERNFFSWDSLKQNIFRRRKQHKEHFIKEQIDPILDKISKVGVKGLSFREKMILRKARHKV